MLSIVNSKVTLRYMGDNHGSLFDGFVLYFSLKSGNQAKAAETLRVVCADDTPETAVNNAFPISYRQRVKNDYIVLVVSQFYSFVELSWVEVYLKHHLQIGVNLIALYTGFRPETVYSHELDVLLDKAEFANKVIRFEWSDVAGMPTWSHSQTSMINHGVNVFLGSTIISADLDEIVVPVKQGSIRPIVNDYSRKYGSWGFNILSYAPNEEETARLKYIVLNKEMSELNWNVSLQRSSACVHPRKVPHFCRAKWIFHSLEPDIMRIHVIRFLSSETFFPEKWLDPGDLVLLHIRSIHGLVSKEPKEPNQSATI